MTTTPSVVITGAEIGGLTAALTLHQRGIDASTGPHLSREPRGIASGRSHAQRSVHRDHLHALLAEAVRERLGEPAILTGAGLTGFTQTADGVVTRRRRDTSEVIAANGEMHNASTQRGDHIARITTKHRNVTERSQYGHVRSDPRNVPRCLVFR